MMQRTSSLLRSALVAAGVIAFGAAAFAASDGTLGLNSTGTTDVTITKGEVAQITGLADIALAPWNTGSPPPAGNTNACVYTSTGNYQVTASSANAGGGNFRLTDSVNFINYTVQWDDNSGGGPTGVTESTALTAQVGSTITNCGGSPNATVSVAITNGQMNAAPVGSYSDTLTLLIAPE